MCGSMATDLLSGETGFVFVLYLYSDKDIESCVHSENLSTLDWSSLLKSSEQSTAYMGTFLDVGVHIDSN